MAIYGIVVLSPRRALARAKISIDNFEDFFRGANVVHAPASEFGSSHASQDLILVLDQIRPTRTNKEAKRKIEGVRC